MIRGTVRQRADQRLEPWVTVSLEDHQGRLHQCQVTVDTGFTGWLTLPPDFIEQLGLVSRDSRAATLASGAIESFDYYHARILWHGQLRPVGVFQSNGMSLLGMQLLKGNRLIVDAWEGGDVPIEEVTPV